MSIRTLKERFIVEAFLSSAVLFWKARLLTQQLSGTVASIIGKWRII